jgi:hypothetical protein
MIHAPEFGRQQGPFSAFPVKNNAPTPSSGLRKLLPPNGSGRGGKTYWSPSLASGSRPFRQTTEGAEATPKEQRTNQRLK